MGLKIREWFQRYGKRTVAAALTLAMVAEQAPWNNLAYLAQAAQMQLTSDDGSSPGRPNLYGFFTGMRADGGASISDAFNTVTLSNKFTATGELQLRADTIGGQSKFNGIGIHIDTPMIFKTPSGGYKVEYVPQKIGTDGNTVSQSPQEYADDKGYTWVGGVEVAFTGSLEGKWSIWNPETKGSLLDEEPLIEPALENHVGGGVIRDHSSSQRDHGSSQGNHGSSQGNHSSSQGNHGSSQGNSSGKRNICSRRGNI